MQMSPNVVLHLDVTPAVRTGRSDLVFSLAVLGGLADPGGRIWLTPKSAYVLIELTITQELVKKVKPVKMSPYIITTFAGHIFPINAGRKGSSIFTKFAWSTLLTIPYFLYGNDR